MKSRVLWIAVVAGLWVGCDRDGGDAAQAPVADADQTASAELLVPLQNVSAAEVEFGQAAAARAVRPDVRSFAQTVAADHRALRDSVDAFARARSLPAVSATATAEELANAVRTAHSGLETLEGEEYDQAYIRAEVESHRLLLARLDQELIPGAADPAVRTLLADIRAMVDAHLTRSRQLLANVLEAPPAPPPVRPAAPPPVPVVPPDTGSVRIR